MRELGSFKRWFSIQQAAALLQGAFGEHVTESDVLEHVKAGHIPVWWDATERYAVPVARGCHCFGMRGDQPTIGTRREIAPEQREQWYRQSDMVGLLDGIYRIAFDARRDREEIFDGEQAGKIIFKDGILLRDADGESLLQVLRRMPGRSGGSNQARDFIVDLDFPTAESFRIASGDLRALLNGDAADVGSDQPAVSSGQKERETLLKQIGALATLVASHANMYRNGDKPNGNQIAIAVGDLVTQMPDSNTHGLSQSNVRANIKEGVSLLRR
ncbi:hypothetical protein QFZ94_003373 [Paraburkholderia sp. JPY465]|uniref:hypothetical protein n=1 Tax=Paraburkholderia sp. JPY465 TaxID=3042285 RepID=UPI003D1CEF97